MSYSIVRVSKVKSGTNTTGIQKHVQRENNNYENEDNQYPVHTAVSIFLPAERTAHGFPASDNSGIPPPVSSSWP